jgi:DNA adenine methylase
MKPLLKWAGGKRHIASVIEANLPSTWGKGRFYEPFLGGAAISLHLRPSKASLSDVNAGLIAFYSEVRDRPGHLFKAISKIADKFDGLAADEKLGYYLNLREEFNSSEPSQRKPELFYALNKLCFNGLYRENSKGGFNVPFGKKTSFPSIVETDFTMVSEVLKKSELSVADFETAVESAKSGDFVYFDPPYIPLKATSSFTAYSSEGFGIDSQKRLADLLIDLKRRGVGAMVSNSSADLTHEIYSGSRIVEITAPRMVSAQSSGRGHVKELLIMNY